jgi:hypothetical protein
VSGDDVRLLGPAAARLVAAVARLEGRDFALVGGLAAMVRIGSAHRATADVDSVFDNPDDPPTTVLLIRSGIAERTAAVQRVVIDGTTVDVIDTEPLPTDVAALPESPHDRLFVCAHRFAYETATPVRVVADGGEATIAVATPAALVAMKAHALAFGSRQRRATKRVSDLHDLYRLVERHPRCGAELAGAPWQLGAQVLAALRADLDIGQDAALLRASPVPELASVTADDLAEAVDDIVLQLDS